MLRTCLVGTCRGMPRPLLPPMRGFGRSALLGADRYADYHRNVPRLPVPTLQETRERLLEYAAPLLTPQQLSETTKAADELLQGDGPALQAELLRLDAESATSYLEGFWDSAYVEARCPSPININPFLAYASDTSTAQRSASQAARGAALLRSAAHFHRMHQDGQLAPDMERDTPLCMRQYEKFLGSTRIPHVGRDSIAVHQSSRHVVVVCNNHYWVLEVLQEDGLPVSEGALSQQLQSIIDSSATAAPPVGLLTADNRDSWAEARARLHAGNAPSLEAVDSALLILSLDNDVLGAPDSEAAARSFLLAEDNRWYDKLQLIVSADAVAGVNIEHSPFDGHTALRFTLEQKAYLHEHAIEDGPSASSPRELRWDIDNETLEHIENARRTFADLSDTTQLRPMVWEGYGGKFSKQHQISPDAFVQMALQLALHRTIPERYPVSTYESGMTKRFLAGRTEVVRSTTSESVAFTRTFLDPKTSATDKAGAFRVAATKHVQRMGEAKVGRAVDRHLYVLSKLAQHKRQRLPEQEYAYPSLFSDPGFHKLSTSTLSTSNCGCDALALFGFGPVVGDGTGVGYMIFNDKLVMCTSSFTSEADKFNDNLKLSLGDIRAVLTETSK